MNIHWQEKAQIRSPSAGVFLPPVMVDETGWDILLALYSDERSELSLEKLGALVSVPQAVLTDWLAGLEERQLIIEVKDTSTGKLRAILTSAGRELLDKYLSATGDLQVGTHH